ncbi:VPLPA-CTERM sorting domain-containing protein [Tateyamaria sp.]|uniref:VPLPA-CTERM sorting domain-containing protein n=1 Tax=Tateyamaria sp. TaxID=1929288 RepID=UPI0032A0CD71
MRLLTVTIALLLGAGAAHATTLEFDDVTCSGASCANYGNVDQIAGNTYGDETGLDVSWAGSNGTSPSPILYWTGNYSGLNDVVWTSSNDATGSLTITLAALTGYQVTLDSFQLGSFNNQDRTSSVSITELGTTTSFLDTGAITILGSTPTTISGPYTSNSGIVISFGPSAYNVGLDNLSYTVSEIDPNVVPLPAGLPLLLAGLGSLYAVRRKRK